MSGLRIAPGLELPVDAVTQSMAILARRGAGKTYTGSVIVEEAIGAHVPVVVLDPTGAWWGLRSSIDGERPGLPVVIFGGEHGDVPLEPTAGTVLADVVIEHPGAYVIDMSGLLSKAAEQRFAADFLERLYRAKKRETGPLLVVVDEADSFAPQRPGPEQTRTLGALESIVRRGRIKGLGDLLITQRAAVLNKNVLTQTEILVAMQTTGPQDRAAIDAWIEGNGTPDERAQVMGSLASLERGEAWVWSPSFLRILQRVRIRARTTFDSSRTPEAGEAAIAPRAFAKVDLEALGARIAATVERAKADDPRELRRRIHELERQAATRPAEARVETVEKVVADPALSASVRQLRKALEAAMKFIVRVNVEPPDDGWTDEEKQALERAIDSAVQSATKVLDRRLEQRSRDFAAVRRDADRVLRQLRAVVDDDIEVDVDVRRQEPFTAEVNTREQHGRSVRGSSRTETEVRALPPAPDGEVHLKAGARRILETLARHHPMVFTRPQVGTLTGFKISGGTFQTYWSLLRRAGYVEERVGPMGSEIRVTEAGLDEAGVVPAAPSTTDELLAMWGQRLKAGARQMLDVLVESYPEALAYEALGERVGMTITGGTFQTYISTLRRNGLAETGSGSIRASDALFVGGGA